MTALERLANLTGELADAGEGVLPKLARQDPERFTAMAVKVALDPTITEAERERLIGRLKAAAGVR